MMLHDISFQKSNMHNARICGYDDETVAYVDDGICGVRM
jgi:hypothetical protein